MRRKNSLKPKRLRWPLWFGCHDDWALGKGRELGRKSNRARGLGWKRNKYVNPPSDQAWLWESREMLECPAYHARSINARRVWDALRLEHLRNGALENGNLVMPYNELQRVYGCSRALIRDAIDELVALGFLAEGEPREVNGNHRPANTYRLTFLGTGVSAPPTNEWKRFKGATELVELVKRDTKEKRQKVRQAQRALRQGHQARGADLWSDTAADAISDAKVVSLTTQSRRSGGG
jgi:hypothetical protein